MPGWRTHGAALVTLGLTLANPAKAQDGKTDLHAALGRAYLIGGQYEQAISEFDLAIVADPHSAQALEWRGRSFGMLGKFKEALADLDRATAVDPELAEVDDVRGDVYRDRGDYSKAIDCYTQELERTPDDSVLLRRSQCREQTGDLGGAADDYTSAILAATEGQKALFLKERGLFYLRGGGGPEAVADFTACIEAAPGGSALYALRGRAFEMDGDLDRAIADLDVAIRLNPERPEIYRVRGKLHEKRGSQADAKFDFRKAEELAKTTPATVQPMAHKQVQLQIDLGCVYASHGAPDEALNHYEQALAIDPRSADALRWRATAERDLGKFKEALADVDRAATIEPNLPFLNQTRGEIHQRHGDDAQAIECFTQELKQQPRAAFTYSARAKSYAGLKNYAAAIADFDSAVALADKSEKCLFCFERGQYYLINRREEDAIADFTYCIREQPKEATYYAKRGEAFASSDSFKKAAADLTTAIQLSPNVAEFYRQRGRTFEQLGDKVKAQADFQKAAELSPKK